MNHARLQKKERWVLERLWRTYRGFWGLVVLNPIGFRNGYVRLPDGHPWHGLDHDDIPVDVHGGLTFSGEYPAFQLENGDGVPDGWWIGFDCGHIWDAPEPEVWARATSGYDWIPSGGHLWSTDEVASQVEFLSAQVFREA